MMTRERLERVANMYIIANKTLKTLDKKKSPERYESCLELIATAGLILRRHGVTITL